jgi:hypothetical protein
MERMTSYCVEFSGFERAANNASMFALYAGSFSIKSKRTGTFTDSAEKRFFMLRPFGWAQDRQAQHEQKIVNVFNVSSVRLEPFDFAQDRLVEG